MWCLACPRQYVNALVLGLFSLVVVSGCHRSDAAAPLPPVARAANGQRFEVAAEALLQEVGRAICQQDRAALQRLEVSDEEYRDVVLPGSVLPGEPPLRMPREKAEFFTRMHRTKSEYALRALLASCPLGGLRFERVELPPVAEQRAGYAFYRDPKLVFVDGSGATVELRPGSVVQLGSEVKMLSYYVE